MNNNAYQISRALYHNSNTGGGINELSAFVKADFMHMPFEDNSFDAIYQIDATCHAPDQVGCYKVRRHLCCHAVSKLLLLLLWDAAPFRAYPKPAVSVVPEAIQAQTGSVKTHCV